jgi:CubicO group peptidase (beta-lactamase class C family)
MGGPVAGHWDRRFAPVADWLAGRVADGIAVGEAIAVVADGRTLVDIRAGLADAGAGRGWRPDTIACLFSAGKPLVAAAVLHLIDRGRIALDAPVTRYWPGYGTNGKEGTSVRHVLCHMAGVPAADAAPPGSAFDAAALAGAIEAQAPMFAPGTQGCFHSFTYGVLGAELVRRVDGRPLPRYFREEIAGPLGLDLHFGLDAATRARCATLIPVPENPLYGLMTDPANPVGRSWRPFPWESLNRADFRASGFASLGGHGSALGLARFYSALAGGGTRPEGRLLGAELAAEMRTEQWHQDDPFMGAPVRMGLGVMLSNPALDLGGESTFAQPGLGGVAGIGDPDLRLGIGIVPNRLGGGLDIADLRTLLALVRAAL